MKENTYTEICMITQIRRNDKWEYVKDVPQSFTKRISSTFAFLAGVEEDLPSGGFQSKGLPDDLDDLKFGFNSSIEEIKKCYETETCMQVRLENGEYIKCNDERLKVECKTEDEAKQYPHYHHTSCCLYPYISYDPKKVNGELVEVHLSEWLTFEEYLECHHLHWDEEQQDYGDWTVDLSHDYYYKHSYLTLKELKEKDLSLYLGNKEMVSKQFYQTFLDFGGVMPEEIKVMDGKEIYLVWKNDKIKEEDMPVVRGIHELEEIARKYGVSAEDIRIVFAFEN